MNRQLKSVIGNPVSRLGGLRLAGNTALALAVLWSGAARADFHISPYAGVTDEYNSNIFYIPPGAPDMVNENGASRSDNVVTTQAGADLTYTWSQQKFHATAQISRLDYEHFDELTHNESLLDGGLDWKLASLFDGTVDYQRSRHVIPFYLQTSGSSALEIETDNVAKVGVNLQISPVWRLENLATASNDDSPRVGLPDLSTHERYVQSALRYVGFSNLSAGLQLGYLNGDFNGEPPGVSPYYHQDTAQFVANYMISGLTTLNAAAGYTNRSQSGADVSGFTGNLGYTRQLTGKTSMSLQLSRVIQTYITTEGTEVDTSAGLGFTWQATPKIAVTPGYVWTYSTFPGELDLQGSDRLDHEQNLNLDVTYQMVKWLSLRPYVRYQTRKSNEPQNLYNVDIYGIQLLARLP